MNPDTLRVYEMWEGATPSLPPRSRLYPLEPLGLGSLLSESLTSYIARLAEAHSVLTSTFVVQELLPHYARSYLPKNRTVLWFSHARAFNGAKGWAKDMVAVVEALTARSKLQFLTWLPWAEAISARGLLRKRRAWCPTCFEVWRQRGKTIYEPLLWTLAVVTVCPLHGQPLQTCCPYCQQTLPWLEAYMRPGYCSRCKCWLGSLSTSTLQEVDADFEWHLWTAKAMGDLVGAGPGLSDLPQRKQAGQGLIQAMNQLAVDTIPDFYRLLQVHNCRASSRVWWWCTGQALPELYGVLRLCHCLRVPPVDLLTGQVKIVDPPRTFTANERPSNRSKSSTSYPEQTRLALEEILTNPQEPPLSLNQTAKRLGYYGHTSLMRTFPEHSRIIVERYRLYQDRILAACKLETERKIRQAIPMMTQRGETPTQTRVAAVLGKTALNRWETGLLHEILQELVEQK